MPTQARTVSTDVVEGRIHAMREAIPLFRGNIHLVVGGQDVFGTIEDPAAIRTLRIFHGQRRPVRIGLLIDAQGLRHFSWLIADAAGRRPKKAEAAERPGIAPRFYRGEWRRMWRMTGIGVAVAAASLALAWVLGIGAFWRAVAMSVSLAVALAGIVFAGVALHGLWRNRRDRRLILESEARYLADDGRPVSGGPDTPVSPPTIVRDEARLVDAGPPPIGWVRGALAGLTYEPLRQFNGGPAYGIYRFAIGSQKYVMYAGEDVGNPTPFLAEGDDVELVVHAADSTDRQERMVFAMRNRADRRVYVCHKIFRGRSADVAPPGVGFTQRGPLLQVVGGLLLATWLMLVAIFHFGGSSGDEEVRAIAMWALVAGVGIWLCVALPFRWRDARWRGGRPTRKQRTLERIYEALGIGTPFAPTEVIEEL